MLITTKITRGCLPVDDILRLIFKCYCDIDMDGGKHDKIQIKLINLFKKCKCLHVHYELKLVKLCDKKHVCMQSCSYCKNIAIYLRKGADYLPQ